MSLWRSEGVTLFYIPIPNLGVLFEFPVFNWRLASSSCTLCSIKNCAVLRHFCGPVIVTIRFLVPGLYVPFFEIWIFAPLNCWISTIERPAGPRTAPTRLSFTSMSILESCSSRPGGGGGGRGLPAVARPKELLLTGRVW